MTRRCSSGLTAALLLIAAVRVHASFAWFLGVPLASLAASEAWLRHSALGGSVFGMAVALEQVPWVAAAVRNYFDLPATTAAGAVVAVGAACGALWGALLGLALWCAGQGPAWARSLLVAAAWVTWERLLVVVFPNYPWVSVAATQTAVTPLLGWASIVGSAGLSFVVIASGAALRGLWLADGPASHRIRALRVGSALLLPGLPLVAGMVRTGSHGVTEETPRCAITGIDAQIHTASLPAERVLEGYEKASATAAGSVAVVWPESAVPGYPLLDSEIQARLRAIAQRLGAVLIAGGPRIEWSRAWQPRQYNSAYRVESEAPIEHYDKRALVPLAEHWPLGAWARGPASIAGHIVDRGARPGIFRAGSCRFGILICSEAERADLARELARSGVDGLLVLSNDANLPERGIQAEIAQARLRAAENGVWVVRVANRGRSVAIDPLGRTAAEIRGGSLDVRIGRPTPSAALVLGPATETGCTLLTLYSLALGAARWLFGTRPRPKFGSFAGCTRLGFNVPGSGTRCENYRPAEPAERARDSSRKRVEKEREIGATAAAASPGPPCEKATLCDSPRRRRPVPE